MLETLVYYNQPLSRNINSGFYILGAWYFIM